MISPLDKLIRPIPINALFGDSVAEPNSELDLRSCLRRKAARQQANKATCSPAVIDLGQKNRKFCQQPLDKPGRVDYTVDIETRGFDPPGGVPGPLIRRLDYELRNICLRLELVF